MIMSFLVLVLSGLLLTRLSVDAEALDGGVTVFVLCGPWSFRVWPGLKIKPKPKSEKKPKKEDEEKSTDKPESKFSDRFTYSFLKKLAGAAFRMLRRLGSALNIDLLHLNYTAAASKVSDAAILYGRANAVLCVAYPLLRGPVRDLDLSVDLDYAAAESAVYFRLVISLQVWEILYAGLAFVTELLNILYWER